MAFLENGSPVATKLGPIAQVNTALAGKATATSIFAIADTTRIWLQMPQTTAGTYACVTSTGTATLYVFNTSYDLIQEIAVTTTSNNTTIAENFHRIECVASGALDLSISPVNAKISSAGGTMILEQLTSTGNYGLGSSNSAGSNNGYATGQYAHVIVAGASGGGSGGNWVQQRYGPYGTPGSTGGNGGVAASTTAIALSGTYAITIGAGGTAGSNSFGGGASGGGTGGTTNAFNLTATGGAGGSVGYTPGAEGSPAKPTDTDIYLGVTNAELSQAGGNGANRPGPNTPNAGSAGRVLVLRWTP
jgi:hypothetical protein